MKFGIVGAGAMGCLLGSFLAKANEDVWLVDVWKDHVDQINREGLSVLIDGRRDFIPARATTNAEDAGLCDVIIISTKFQHTRTAVQSALGLIHAGTIVMTVQNGIGNVEIISDFVDKKQVVFGLTTLGSVIKGPGKIEATFTDEAVTYLWPLTGEPDVKVENMIHAFKTAGLDFRLSVEVHERIWKKLCLNAGLSVPLAIPKLRCGDFINQSPSRDLIRDLIFEIVAVANKEGIALEPEASYEYVVDLAKQAPDHLTSALVDVLHHRKTEIDSLNGAIVAKAREYGISVPVNKAIVNLIKIIENTYDQSIREP